jgi:hypothetical protein
VKNVDISPILSSSKVKNQVVRPYTGMRKMEISPVQTDLMNKFSKEKIDNKKNIIKAIPINFFNEAIKGKQIQSSISNSDRFPVSFIKKNLFKNK